MIKIIIICCIFCFQIFRASSFASNQKIVNQDLDKIETIYASESDVDLDEGKRNTKREQRVGEDDDKIYSDLLGNDERDRAIEADMTFAGFYMSGGYTANYFHYSEWSGDEKLDEDFGNHHGFYYAAGYRSPQYYDFLKGKPYCEAYYQYYANIIHYKGALIGGGSYDADQRSKIAQYGIKIGAYNDFAKPGEIYGFFDVGKRVWDRGEDNPPDYHEKYYWPYFGGGMGINHLFFSKLSVGLETEVMAAYSPKMHAYDGIELVFNLRHVWGAEIKMPVKYRLLKNLSFDITPGFTYWSIDASEMVPTGVGGWYWQEPQSKTHQESILLGMTYGF